MIEMYREIVRIIEKGERAALATVVGSTGSIPAKECARLLLRSDGTTLGTVGGGRLESEVLAIAREVLETDAPQRRSFRLVPGENEIGVCGGTAEILIEPVGSPTVFIFGAGHVGRAVSRLALFAGLNTVIVDDREEHASRIHFPEPARLVVADYATAFERLAVDESSLIVIVTRGHVHDEVVLAGAIRTRARYIGLIGSRAKIQIVRQNLLRQGADPQRLRDLQAPIGLDIGARTCEEIAVSIVAGLIAHRRSRFLRGDRSSPPAVPEPSGS